MVGLMPAPAASLAALLLTPSLVLAQGPWMFCEDELYASVEGATIALEHRGALYNCCADGFEFSADLQDSVIDVVETELVTTPCACACCTTPSTEIIDVPPGDYVIVLHWYDYESSAWEELSVNASVPDVGQGGSLWAGPCDYPGCFDPNAAPGGAMQRSSWSRLKAIYR